MAISHPRTLRHWLSQLNKHPLKRLSQNFLIDQNICQKVIRKAEVEPGELTCEIGPGPGALSEEILNRGGRLVAIEKDRLLAQELHRFQTEDHRLHVIAQDCLEVNYQKVLSPLLQPEEKALLLSSLPYQITTPIITLLAPYSDLFSRQLYIMQREVAKRATAQPGGKEYGSLTLFLHYYGTSEELCSIPPTAFYPAPSVHSSLVLFRPEKRPTSPPPEFFFPLVRTAFQQRRKTLRHSLRSLFSVEEIAEALAAQSIRPDARPEMLSFEEFAALSVTLYGLNPTCHLNLS